MNRRTALGAIAASPILVASAGAATPDNVTVDVPHVDVPHDESIAQTNRAWLAEKCFIALISAGHAFVRTEAAERAFELADAFAAEAQRRRGY